MAAPRRILFLSEGATMLHFVRPLVLASALDPERHDIHFYTPSRFRRHLDGQPFSLGDLATMPGERFLDNISRGAPMFPSAVIRSYVEQDRQIIRRVKPDLVIGDLRLSLPISARLESVPCAVLMNAYWSPYAERRRILPEVPITRVIPPRFLGGIYRLTEPLAYFIHVRQINAVRREFGIPALPADLRALYTEGGHVLYGDVPEFVPTTNLPAHHHYLGACNWEFPAAKPSWWSRMLDDPKPKVFVSLGSSGPVRILPALLSALAKLPVAVMLATSGRAAPSARPGLYTADLLPFSEAAACSKLVVSHGGSGGLYPAMAAGTPVLGIPSNADQHLSTAMLVASGAGLGVRVEEASEQRITIVIEALLSDARYSLAARHWASVYSKYDSAALFNQFIARA